MTGVSASAFAHTHNPTDYGPGATSARAMEAVLRSRLGTTADRPLSSLAWGATRRPRGAPRPHLCLVSHLASRTPSATFLLRSYSYTGGSGCGAAPEAHEAGLASAGVRLAGESGLSLLDSLRATSAAPWYLEEVCVSKDLVTGEVFPAGRKPPDGAVTSTLRLIDGGLSCNNPTDVAIHEARLLFGRERPLLVVSVGTGSGTPTELAPHSYFPLWLQHVVNATGGVADTDATVRHLLSGNDTYWRFHPVGDDFGCGLDDARAETLNKLTLAADAYMDSQAGRVAQLAAALVNRQ